jgi:2-amino-4-hydroxy-6-hydroxymethyldihydropteridine diphosphokinase/dihydroneopterin aldolase
MDYAPDTIEICNLKIEAAHGLLQQEKNNPQRFEVSARIRCDLTIAGESDDISFTFDYREIANLLRDVFNASPVNLIEFLAAKCVSLICDIAAELITFVSSVEVTVCKLKALGLDCSAKVTVRRPVKRRVFIGLGSNLGDKMAHIKYAVDNLPDLKRVSDVYETTPVGGPGDQNNYLNAVAELYTDLHPHELLKVAKSLEAEKGRVRGPRWGPRTLDVDILTAGNLKISNQELTVPHPELKARRFVLVPLMQLAPDLVDQEQLILAAGDVRRYATL